MSLANGVEYCVKNGVEVINISIELDTHVDYIHEIIGNAISDDVVVVISAGNNSNNTNSIYDHTNTYRKYKIRNSKKEWKKYK